MSAHVLPHAAVGSARISAPALRRALTAGMRRLVSRREWLNRINVFPVPDGDTGSNLAFTVTSVLQGSLNRPARSAGALLRAVADDAIDGARGNSGAILAQFLCGASEAVGEQRVLDCAQLASAAKRGAEQARGALAEPREGTILSVIQAFAEGLQSGGELRAWFAGALAAARRALADTPKQLAVLRQAGVVDAGAQGFVDLLEGIDDYLQDKTVDNAAEQLDDTQEFAGSHWHEEADAQRPWCSECLIDASELDRQALHAALRELGADSVVLAGGRQRLRLHAHVADPGRLFELAAQFGQVKARKADDMRAQHRAAQRAAALAVITDSAADLPASEIERLGSAVVPVRLSFGAEDFLDKVSMSPREFYRRVGHETELPRTSQPPPGDFRRQFELSLDHSPQVAYVGLSRALSGTLQSAEAAAQRVAAGRVLVIDSHQAGGGQGLLVLAAAELALAGGNAAQVAERVAQLRPLTFTYAIARDVRYAVRGGRIPRWAAPLALGLGLTPIARVRDNGTLGIAAALLGHARVPERFARYLAKRLPAGQRWRLLVGHAGAEADGAALLAALRRQLDCAESWLVEAGPAIGAHTGPGALVVGAQAIA